MVGTGIIATPDVRGHRLLEGCTVVVTAAAGAGIGSATATRAVREGADVVVSDKHAARLVTVADELAAAAPDRSVVAIECDVTEVDGLDRLLDEAERALGPVDVLVNNAGLGGSAPLTEMTDAQWHTVLDVTLTSAFRGTRAALRRMIPRGTGTIVNVASVTGWRAEAGQAHYASAKAGVMALTRAAAMEGAPYGVRVNAVAPTLALNPFSAKTVPPDELEAWIAVQPQGRAADPGEVANVVAFLASDRASYLTGEVISVGALHP